MEKLFVCCNKNDIITQASGLLLGVMIGYAIFKNDEKKESDDKPIITVDKNGNEVEISDVEDKTESPAPLDFLDAINSGILEYAGPVYTTIRTGAILITIASLPYRAIIFIRNWIYPQLREVPMQERILRGIGESKQLNLKLLQELKKNIKINKDELLSKTKSQQEKNEINKQDEDINNILRNLEDSIKKGEEEGKKFQEETDIFLGYNKEGILMRGNKKIPLEEGKIKIDVYGQEVIEESAQIPYLQNIDEAGLQQENINIWKDIKKKIAENSGPSMEMEIAREYWQNRFKDIYKVANKEEQIKNNEKESPIIILTPEENNLFLDNFIEQLKKYNELKLSYENLRQQFLNQTIEEIINLYEELKEFFDNEIFNELVITDKLGVKDKITIREFLLKKASNTKAFYDLLKDIATKKELLQYGPESQWYKKVKSTMGFWNRIRNILNTNIKNKLYEINEKFIDIRNRFFLIREKYNATFQFNPNASPKKNITVEELNTVINMQGKEEKIEKN